MENMNLKILQVIDTLDIGGAEKVFVEVCNILYEKRVDVSALFLLKTGKLGEELNNNIHVIELNRTNKWSLSTMNQCSKTLKEYDIIHCHLRHVSKYVSLVCKLFNIKAKIIFHDHNGPVYVDKLNVFLLNTFFRPDVYITVNSSKQKWGLEKLKLKNDKIFVLENIVKKNIKKQRYDNNYDLILVSNVKPLKNNKFALEVIERLNVSLLIVGQNQDDLYFNEIIKKKIEKKLNCDIDVSIQNVQPILHCSKLGLHTSLSESGPLVLIEYLAQGLPFLAYETGEVSKILKPYFPDYFIDNFEIENWIKRIKLLLSKEVEVEKMKTVFEKHFGTEQYFKKIISIYQCLKN